MLAIAAIIVAAWLLVAVLVALVLGRAAAMAQHAHERQILTGWMAGELDASAALAGAAPSSVTASR